MTVVDVEGQKEETRKDLHPDTCVGALVRVVPVLELLARLVVDGIHNAALVSPGASDESARSPGYTQHIF